MKTENTLWRFLQSARPAIVAGLVAAAIFSATLVPVLASPAAADPAPTSTATPAAKPALDSNDRLEKRLQQEQKRLALEVKRLTRAGKVATNLQKRIDDLKARNQDTGQLEKGLTAYKNALATAQTSYNSAKTTLDAKAGFDANGKVTDAAKARTTLETARKAMNQTLHTLARGIRGLDSGRRTFTLSQRLAVEQKAVDAQQRRLDRAGKTVTRTQTLIGSQNSKGKDTSKVETALGDFQKAILASQASHDNAKKILDARAGFGSNGQVTGVAQAGTTLQTARQAMVEARQTLNKGARALVQAVRQFRQGNR